MKSSTIKHVDYDPKTLTLKVTFHTGATYHYHNVPQPMHESMMNSKSLGSFLHENIKPYYKAIRATK